MAGRTNLTWTLRTGTTRAPARRRLWVRRLGRAVAQSLSVMLTACVLAVLIYSVDLLLAPPRHPMVTLNLWLLIGLACLCTALIRVRYKG